MSKDETKLTFEQAMEQLELIVAQLDSGDVPLEKAIELFQDGMKLSQLCSRKLDHVERKIEILMEQEGELVKKPFQPSSDEKGESH